MKKVKLLTVAMATTLLASCGGGSSEKNVETSDNIAYEEVIEDDIYESVDTLTEGCDTIPVYTPEATPEETKKKVELDKTPIIPTESGYVVSVSESVFGEFEGCFEVLAEKFPTEKSEMGAYSFSVEIKRTDKVLPFSLSKAACVDDVFSKKKIFYGFCVEILDKNGRLIKKLEGRSLYDYIGKVERLFKAKAGDVCKLELSTSAADMMFADEPAMVRISSILEDKTEEDVDK